MKVAFKLPKRPKGKMSEANALTGWDRAHNFDQLPGQPKRVYRGKVKG